MPEIFSKQYVEKLSVYEVLRLIYERELHETSIEHMSKEKLRDFIMEAFDKGHLNYYLNLKYPLNK
jgi:galactose-1-phosphate uridylyltransferase